MEYISAEEFFKQDKEVQKVLLEWWQPNLGDLFARTNTKYLPHLVWKFEDECVLSNCESFWREKDECIPLLTEGQIRNFIEDKTGCKNIEILSNIEYGEYDAMLYKAITSGITEHEYYNLGIDKLQSYWKVALEIAKESLIKR